MSVRISGKSVSKIMDSLDAKQYKVYHDVKQRFCHEAVHFGMNNIWHPQNVKLMLMILIFVFLISRL